MKKVVILSHGNALAERGVSTNKKLLQDNLMEESIVLLRHAHDGIKEAGGVDHFEVSASMLSFCRSAYRRSVNAQELRKQNEAKENKETEKKKKLEKELKGLETKKRQLSEEAMEINEKMRDLKRRHLQI